MKGKITKDGILWIERAGTMTTQDCMKSIGYLEWLHGCKVVARIDNKYCSHNCPLFGELEELKEIYGELGEKADIKHALKICENRTLIFNEFTDERGSNETD